MGEKNYSKVLRPRTQARGVIPEKVSDLLNDAKYVTQEDLETLVKVEYTGKKNDTAEVIVNNIEKTIEVFSKGENIKDSLPKEDDGRYSDGVYALQATVVDGVPVLQWVVSSGEIVTSPYYYGLVTLDSIDSLTSDIVKSLTQDGIKKENKEYRFVSKKQRQVMAYPAKFGKLSSIIHVESGINITTMFNILDLIIDGVGYYVYINHISNTGTFTYSYNY